MVYDERERAVLEYAEVADIDTGRRSAMILSGGFTSFSRSAEIVELAAWVALENFRSRFNAGLGLASEGFSDSCRAARRDQSGKSGLIMAEAGRFVELRPVLFGIAYRMLGSAAEADDIVQEAYIRWAGVDDSSVDSPRAYLTTIVTSLSIDHLRSAKTRRETYRGPWLPEPVAVRVDRPRRSARSRARGQLVDGVSGSSRRTCTGRKAQRSCSGRSSGTGTPRSQGPSIGPSRPAANLSRGRSAGSGTGAGASTPTVSRPGSSRGSSSSPVARGTSTG